jgi:hypothetical protein
MYHIIGNPKVYLMEAGARDKIMPSYTSRKVLNPSQKRIMKNQRLKILTQRV